MSKPATTAVMAYKGIREIDAVGRALHEFHAEVCGRMAAVLIPLPQHVRPDDDLKHEMLLQAADAFRRLEQQELARN